MYKRTWQLIMICFQQNHNKNHVTDQKFFLFVFLSSPIVVFFYSLGVECLLNEALIILLFIRKLFKYNRYIDLLATIRQYAIGIYFKLTISPIQLNSDIGRVLVDDDDD